MAKKLPRLQRVLDAPALFSIAYGEIASSIYFALGIIAFHALGFTPLVLLAAGALFLLVSLSYAEGTAAIRETGGAVTLVHRTRLHRWAVIVALVDFATQLLIIGLGLALVFSPDALTRGTSLGHSPSWHDIAFALPLAMLAYTGLETIANLAEETRRPGRTLPRSLFSSIGLVVVLYVLIAVVALSAFPPEHGTELGSTWLRSPLLGIVTQLRDHLPNAIGWPLQVFVGLSGALILLTAATTSISGFGRLAYSLGEHGQLPREFGWLSARTLVSPQSIIAAAVISMVLLAGTAALTHPVFFLASLFSFGVLLAFTATQLAVIRLRVAHPAWRRPYRVPLSVGRIPIPSVIGALLTFAIWIDALATHKGARYGGPAWLAAGIVLYVVVRKARGEGLTQRVVSADEHRGP